MSEFWFSIAAFVISILSPMAIFIGRHWIIARISTGVRHRFDVQLENLRADLRRNEERYRSELREQEATIATLRQNVLAGSASRQALLDKRRFQAVERVWTAVNDFAKLKQVAATMSVLNIQNVAREAGNPKMQQFLSVIGAGVPDIQDLKNVARDEEPYLPQLAWAYFKAYSSILIGSHSLYMLLKAGETDPDKYLKRDADRDLLKTLLPHAGKWIDENKPEAYYQLLSQIERLLLVELRRALEGKAVDIEAAARSKEIDALLKEPILDAIRRIDEEQIQVSVPDELKKLS